MAEGVGGLGAMKVAHTYMGAGPTVPAAASLAHTGQVVRVKTKGQTFFLECDAGETPVQLITRLKELGHVSPQPYELHFEKVPKKKQGGYLARLQRGPIPLDDYKPISTQQIGPEEILCYVQVSDINTANINDQTYEEVDEELRATAWYQELARQMEEERVRRVAAEEERARRQAEAEAKAQAEAEAKAAKKKGGKKKKKK